MMAQKTRQTSACNSPGRGLPGLGVFVLFLVPLFVCPLSGCVGLSKPFDSVKEVFAGKPKPPPSGPADTLVLRGDKLETEKQVEEKGNAELEGAKELYRRGEDAKA